MQFQDVIFIVQQLLEIIQSHRVQLVTLEMKCVHVEVVCREQVARLAGVDRHQRHILRGIRAKIHHLLVISRMRRLEYAVLFKAIEAVLGDARRLAVAANRHLPMPDRLQLGQGPWMVGILIHVDVRPLPLFWIVRDVGHQKALHIGESSSDIILTVEFGAERCLDVVDVLVAFVPKLANLVILVTRRILAQVLNESLVEIGEGIIINQRQARFRVPERFVVLHDFALGGAEDGLSPQETRIEVVVPEAVN